MRPPGLMVDCTTARVGRVDAKRFTFSNDRLTCSVQRANETERMVGASLTLTLPMRSVDYGSEADLLAACRRQDVRAFEQLYHAHLARLKSMAFHIVGNRQDAEDAVQETFVKVYRGIQGFQGQSGIGTWL